jgi:hypothetical protein
LKLELVGSRVVVIGAGVEQLVFDGGHLGRGLALAVL